MFSGYLSMAYYWAMMAEVAATKLASGEGDKAFYEAKLETAEFYFSRLLPRAKGHAGSMSSSTESVMGMDLERFTAR
jgi:hypothetical protein